jgi:hypothetical protein
MMFLEGFEQGGIKPAASQGKLEITSDLTSLSPYYHSTYNSQNPWAYSQGGGAIIRPSTVIAHISGAHLDDEIYGTDRGDVILAGGGKDRIESGKGNDSIFVGAGWEYQTIANPYGYFSSDYEGIYDLAKLIEITSTDDAKKIWHGNINDSMQTLALGFFLNEQGQIISQPNEALRSQFAQGSTVDGGEGADNSMRSDQNDYKAITTKCIAACAHFIRAEGRKGLKNRAFEKSLKLHVKSASKSHRTCAKCYKSRSYLGKNLGLMHSTTHAYLCLCGTKGVSA